MTEADVEAHLLARGVRFCLIGARALAYHGVVRNTLDTDYATTSLIVLDDDFWPPEMTPDLRRGGPTDPLAGVVRFDAPPLDVVVVHTHATRLAIDTAVAVSDRAAPVADALGLAMMKLEAGGFNDMGDVAHLIAARERAGDGTLRSQIEAHLELLSGWGRRAWSMVAARLDQTG